MTGDMGMTYHAMFSLYIMTGLLALVISVSLFCKSIAEAIEWKKKFGERNWDYLYRVLIALVAIATSGYAIFILFENAIVKNSFWEKASGMFGCAGTDSESTRCGTRMFRYLWYRALPRTHARAFPFRGQVRHRAVCGRKHSVYQRSNPVMRLHLEVLERVLGGGKNHERGI